MTNEYDKIQNQINELLNVSMHLVNADRTISDTIESLFTLIRLQSDRISKLETQLKELK